MRENPFGRLSKLSEDAREKLSAYGALLREINGRVNLLSRKDTDDLEYRHIALCAAISEIFEPRDGASIADVGTGGGLPGVVLSILYPRAKVSMFDGVGKKVCAINEMVDALGLTNARAYHERIEEHKGRFDYATGRAVCALPQFFRFLKGKLRPGKNGNLPNGVLYFKGGCLEDELIQKRILPDAELDLQNFFGDALFEGKKICHFAFGDVARI